MTNDGRCNACSAGEHADCAGVIQWSDGDRYLCECACLPLEELSQCVS